ncbi:hypothetical protein CTEN210_11924 [Chaetoceros tenuissimus]|uniref:Uncharacterized protein n=1 Tax=Chaetoceros tenuissimus TaxID=426638 RepID=A0AAD3D077_9STRA|nr:hypothetical protein CTEN210_11924 [Chaetoceros tenuissimus]
MENAKPGHTVEFHGLKGAAHLNGTQGHLVRFLKNEKRWVVRLDGDEYKTVNAKPDNLKRVEPKKVIYQNPLTGQYMTPTSTSRPVTAPSTIVNGGIQALHHTVLDTYHKLKKGGIVVSFGNDYMFAIEYDGPHGSAGIYGEMVYVDKNPLALRVVRERGCQRANELGRNFLAGETIRYIDTTDEEAFFGLLMMYKQHLSTQGYIDVKSGLKLFNIQLAK